MNARPQTIRWNPEDGAPLDAVVARAQQMTILVLLAVDFVIVKRIAPLRRALGAT